MLDLISTPVVVRPQRQLLADWKVDEPRKLEVVYACECMDALNIPMVATGIIIFYFPDERITGIEVYINRISGPWYFCQILGSDIKVKAQRHELRWSQYKEPLS